MKTAESKPPQTAGDSGRREITFSADFEVGGRSQPVGHFHIYYDPAKIGWDARTSSAPSGQYVEAYYIHRVRIVNTGDQEIKGQITVHVGHRDDRYVRFDDRQVIVACEQVAAEPGGPHVTLTPLPDPKLADQTAEAAGGELHLHAGESVSLQIVTMTTKGLPSPFIDKAVVKIRGPITVIEKPWGWKPGAVDRDPLEEAQERASLYSADLERTKADAAAFRKRVRIAVMLTPLAFFALGFFAPVLGRLAKESSIAVATAVRVGGYGRALLTGLLLVLSGVGASAIAALFFLPQKWHVVRDRRFWILVAATLVASIALAHMTQAPVQSEPTVTRDGQ